MSDDLTAGEGDGQQGPTPVDFYNLRVLPDGSVALDLMQGETVVGSFHLPSITAEQLGDHLLRRRELWEKGKAPWRSGTGSRAPREAPRFSPSPPAR